MWGLSFEDSVKMIKALRSGQTSDIEKKIPAIIHLQRKMLNDGSVGFIIHASEESGFTALVAHDPAYIHVWRGIVALAESLAREGDIHDPIGLMKAMLAYRLSAESKTVKVSVGAPDLPIQAMTAHGSKGLEFDHVFIPYANEESWIGKTRGSSFILPQKKVDDHNMRDVRRLFYVALTRAKKHVAVLSSLEESDGRSLTPLRFISELDPESIASVILPRIEAQLPEVASVSNSASNSKIGGDHPDKMVDMAKDVLLDNGLSVTALNHFLECPNKFLYESILKLPQALSPAAEKGTAMHEAISNVWKEENRTTEKIQEIISETVAEYLATSFLAVSEKESVKKELSDDAPIIAQALLPHFAVKGPIFTERWVRTVFDGSYTDISGKTQQVIIPIHGKLDAIVESGRDVQVFDYKTSQAMSVNKIKGETKDSDGGYFRQLIFYKLLLADDPLWKNRNIIPALAFISPDDKGRCPIITVPIMPEDTENLKKQIQSLIDSVWSGSIATAKCSDPACPWCGLRQISI
jgi:DNA helicase-2/ATP-dependent DNA helicase PcrA